MTTNNPLFPGSRAEFADLHQRRYGGLGMRLGLAAMIALLCGALTDAWVLAAGWLIAVVATQFAGFAISAASRRGSEGRRSLRLSMLGVFASATFGTWVYSLIAIVFWTQGGVHGQLFVVAFIASALLHVIMNAHTSPVLLAGLVGAHMLNGVTCFVVAPPGTLLESLTLGASVGLFFIHLRALLMASAASTVALQAAERKAQARAAEAEEANLAKSRFVAAVSHELRTPLNGVLGAADLLARADLAPRERELAETITRSGDALMVLLNDLLDMAKIEAGRLEIARAPYRPRALAEEMARFWAPAAEAKGLNLSIDVADEVPEIATGDAARVRQVICNLISNAIKFTAEGGVRVEVQAVRDPDGASTLRWAVQDTGMGIAPEAQERLFVAFVQGDNSITRKHGGTGLGLAISKRLAELMDGSLDVASSPGAGACFTLETPADPVSRAAAAPLPAPLTPIPAAAGDEAPLRILCADDHPINRLVLERYLAPLGHSVTLVEDGVQALEAATAAAFDLILMDLRMPNMDGLSSAQAIRLGGPNQATPIVIVSADAMADQRAEALANGADGYITKPIDTEALFAVLARARAGRAEVRAAA